MTPHGTQQLPQGDSISSFFNFLSFLFLLSFQERLQWRNKCDCGAWSEINKESIQIKNRIFPTIYFDHILLLPQPYPICFLPPYPPNFLIFLFLSLPPPLSLYLRKKANKEYSIMAHSSVILRKTSWCSPSDS